jgi:hypothetical protein
MRSRAMRAAPGNHALFGMSQPWAGGAMFYVDGANFPR